MCNVIIEDESKRAAVAIPLIEMNNKTYVLFEVRAKSLSQPGDVCFPGGKIDDGETPERAAIRELCEELLIDNSAADVLCQTPLLHNPSITIFPFIVRLKNYEGSFNTSEVSETFLVPLDFFKETEPEKYKVEWSRVPSEDFPYDRIEGGRNYKWRKQIQHELFYNYNGRTIWGVTARIIYYALLRTYK